MVGGVRSRIIVVAASTALAGPLVLPMNENAFILGNTVPSLQSRTETEKEVPDVAEGVNEQLIAVPAFSKSVLSIPFTDSLIMMAYERFAVVLFGD